MTTGINNAKDLSDALDAMTARVYLHDPQVRIGQYQLQEQAYGTELLLGLTHDPNFGQVLVCGLGGIYTEVFKYHSVV